jgi:hypothetical protein
MTRRRAGNGDAAALIVLLLLSGMSFGGVSEAPSGWAAVQQVESQPALTPGGRIVRLAIESSYFFGESLRYAVSGVVRMMAGQEWRVELPPLLPGAFCDCDKL